MLDPIASLRRSAYSCHFIFIANGERPFDDLELLGILGFENCFGVSLPHSFELERVFVSDDGDWVMVGDSMFYEVLNDRGSPDVLASLSVGTTILQVWLGDSDESFGLSLFQDGVLAQELEVMAWNVGEERVVRGNPEDWPELQIDEENRRALIFKQASLAGVRLDRIAERLRAYDRSIEEVRASLQQRDPPYGN